MANIIFLELEEVIAIHHDQIKRYGGSHGIRDLNLLISGISRPQASFAGEDLYSDLFAKASALMHSLILNHPFIDGNKRTAVVSCARFLYVNGYQFTASKNELVKAALKVESKEWDIEKISSWLKKHSKKVS